MGKKIVIGSIGALIVLALVGGLVWAFVSGKLVWVADEKTGTPTAVVCKESLVVDFNAARKMTYRDDSTEPSVDKAKLTSIGDSIKATDGYADDPTCHVMLFWISYYTDDSEGLTAAYKGLDALHDKRKYPNPNTDGVLSMEGYKAIVQVGTVSSEATGANGYQ